MFGMIEKVMAGVILVLLISMYILFGMYENTKEENAVLEIQNASRQVAIDTLSTELKEQTEALKQQSDRSRVIEQDLQRYLGIFKRHNLTKLASAKPGLIEQKINDGTKEVFNGIENDSRTISQLDD